MFRSTGRGSRTASSCTIGLGKYCIRTGLRMSNIGRAHRNKDITTTFAGGRTSSTHRGFSQACSVMFGV